jgi:hypothetical protein
VIITKRNKKNRIVKNFKIFLGFTKKDSESIFTALATTKHTKHNGKGGQANAMATLPCGGLP